MEAKLWAMTFTLMPIEGADAVCVRCAEPITGAMLERYRQRDRRYHLACAIDVDASSARFALESPRFAVADHAALCALADARILAEQDANRLRKKSKDPASIEPARDRKGRPRVRVLCAHSRDGSARAAGFGYFDTAALDDDRTVASSTREYVIVPHLRREDLRIDPSQPWVGALYWQDVGGAVSNGNAKLVEWSALQLPAPVLAIVGHDANDAAKRDKVALKLRALMSRCGFDPDACPVVAGADPDAAFREALLRALDDQAAGANSSRKERSAERVGDTLDALIDEGREEAIVLAIARAAKGYRAARPQEKARTLASIERALVTFPQLAGKALTPLMRSALALPREHVTPIVLAMIALPALPERTEDWLRYWRDLSGERGGLAPAVRAVIEADPESDKSKELVRLFRRVGLAIEGR